MLLSQQFIVDYVNAVLLQWSEEGIKGTYISICKKVYGRLFVHSLMYKVMIGARLC